MRFSDYRESRGVHTAIFSFGPLETSNEGLALARLNWVASLARHGAADLSVSRAQHLAGLESSLPYRTIIDRNLIPFSRPAKGPSTVSSNGAFLSHHDDSNTIAR